MKAKHIRFTHKASGEIPTKNIEINTPMLFRKDNNVDAHKETTTNVFNYYVIKIKTNIIVHVSLIYGIL